MVTGKSFYAALLFSLIAHTAVVAGSFPWRWPNREPDPGTLQDDYIFIGLEAPPAPPPSAPRHSETAAGNQRTSEPGSLAANTAQEDIKKPSASSPEKISGKGAVTSQQLLSDPKNGRIFSEYFQSVKTRIQTVAARHQKFIVRENGKVEVDFVLGPRGTVLSARPNPRSPGAREPLLASRALNIIHESEPFAPFPSEIEATSVSFNITLVFDG